MSVGGAARGKPGLTGVGRVLRNNFGDVIAMFSKSVGIIKSNEAEMLAILEALRFFSSFSSKLVVDRDYLNAIS